MSDRAQIIESLMFDYKTTMNTDFQINKLLPVVKTVYKGKAAPPKRTKSPIKYVETMVKWKNNPVPFDLMMAPKEVVCTDPHEMQRPFSKPTDSEIEEARKTRPRLVMTPAISLDDIKDPNQRQLLINDSYKTHMEEVNRKITLNSRKSITAPLKGLYAPANPITLQNVIPPYVSPEWRMSTTSWDSKQLRSYCDVTKEFWLKRKKLPSQQ